MTHNDEMGLVEAELEKCLVPCIEKRYQIKKIGLRWKDAKTTNFKGFSLWFENEVDIIQSSWQYDLETILSNIGGFIGMCKEFLWLIIMIISSAGAIITCFRTNMLHTLRVSSVGSE